MFLHTPLSPCTFGERPSPLTTVHTELTELYVTSGRSTPDASRENRVVKTQELNALGLIFLHATAFFGF